MFSVTKRSAGLPSGHRNGHFSFSDLLPEPWPYKSAKRVRLEAGGSSEKALVCIIDDDHRMLGALENLVTSVGYDVECHASPHSFLTARRSRAPNCLILDVRLQAESGLDFQERLAAASQRIPIVLITGHSDTPMVVRGMKQGAVDFLAKPFRAEDLLSAVGQAVRLDQRWRELQCLAVDLEQRWGSLTPREKEVMLLVSSGLMNKQIAGQMGLAEATVKIHRRNVMQKMEALSLAELVRMSDPLRQRDAARETEVTI